MSIPDAAVFADLLIRATLLLAAAWIVAGLTHRAGASAAARHLVWISAMAGLLLLPLFSALLPPIDLPVLAATTAGAGSGAPAAAGRPALLAEAALAAYLIVAAGLVARLLLGQWLLARLWRGAAPAEAWDELLAATAGSLGVRMPVALRIDRGPAGPMTWGLLRPKILLPAEAAAWSIERRRLVLLHELAHVARRDCLSRLAAALACALYWFHPAVWHAARRLRLEQELACDDQALLAGAEARNYAGLLLDTARTIAPAAVPAQLASAMARPSQLEVRLRGILGASPRGAPGRRLAGSAAVTAIAVTMLLAAARPVPAAPDAPAPPPAPDAPPAPAAPEVPAARAVGSAPALAGAKPLTMRPRLPRHGSLPPSHIAPPAPPPAPDFHARNAPPPPAPAAAPLPPLPAAAPLPPLAPPAAPPAAAAAPPAFATPPAPPVPPAPPA